jgi:hypothetical protein
MILARLRDDSVLTRLVFLVSLCVLLVSPMRPIGDAYYSLLLSEHVLTRRSFVLDEHFRPPLADEKYPGINGENGPYPYQTDRIDGHVYYGFPVGASLLSIPFVAVLRVVGIRAIPPDGTYDQKGEARAHTLIAAILMAAAGAVFFATARLLLRRVPSVVVAAVGIFGTQIWSNASRAVSADTWGVLLLAIAIYVVLAHEVRGQALRPVALGTLAAWMYITRPPNVPVVIALGIHLAIVDRRSCVRYLAAGACWLAVFVAYSMTLFGTLFPRYYAARSLTFDRFLMPLAAHLVSPGRGLFVYVPVVLFVLWICVRHRRRLLHRRLVWLSALVIGCHMTIISGFSLWHAGASYGPRYTTGIVPWLVLLGVLGLRALFDDDRPRRIELTIGALLAALSVLIQSRGAFAVETWRWNVMPPIETHTITKVWDWRWPQFAAGILPPTATIAELPTYKLGADLDLTSASSDAYLVTGWSAREEKYRWTDGNVAEIALSCDVTPLPVSLELEAGAFLAPGRIERQRLDVEVSGTIIATIHFAEPGKHRVVLPLPGRLLGPTTRIVFRLPDAARPADIGFNADRRMLGLAFSRLRLSLEQAAR